jgi:hypothetical protein
LDSESFCPHLTQIFEFPRIWTHQDRTNSKYALPATVSDAMRLAALNRGHWQVENGLHGSKMVRLMKMPAKPTLAMAWMGMG